MAFICIELFVSDIDECTDGTANCDSNAACTDTEGSFTCTCNVGYTGDGTNCTGKSIPLYEKALFFVVKNACVLSL